MKYYARAVIAFAAFIGATLAASAGISNNEVYFAIPGVESFVFTPIAYSVTSGKAYGGTTSRVSKPSAEGEILVKADHKKSSSVASWFKTQVGAGQTLVCDSTGTFPDKLNFAVKGNLTMKVGTETITSNNITVDQGHFFATNN